MYTFIFLSKYLSVNNRFFFFIFYIDKNYNLPSGQMPMTNINMSYQPPPPPQQQQQPTPVFNEEKSEQQLITFD